MSCFHNPSDFKELRNQNKTLHRDIVCCNQCHAKIRNVSTKSDKPSNCTCISIAELWALVLDLNWASYHPLSLLFYSIMLKSHGKHLVIKVKAQTGWFLFGLCFLAPLTLAAGAFPSNSSMLFCEQSWQNATNLWETLKGLNVKDSYFQIRTDWINNNCY